MIIILSHVLNTDGGYSPLEADAKIGRFVGS